MYKKNAEVTVTIESVNGKGFGIGRDDNFVLFVENALPQDVLRVRILKAKKTYGFAKIIKIITPSPHRITSPCPVSDFCGGCQFQHASYESQLEYKKQIVIDSLERIGKIKNPPVKDVIRMQNPMYYRNKAVFPVVATPDGFAIGMYAPRSHRIIDIDHCLIQNKIHIPILKIIRDFLKKEKIEAYNETNHTGLVRNIVIRTANRGCIVIIVINGKNFPKVVTLAKELEGIGDLLINIHTEKNNNIMGYNFKRYSYLTEHIGDIKYRFGADSFFQTNPIQTEVLYKTAIKQAEIEDNHIVLDAHAGVGGVALFAAKYAKTVIGIDIMPKTVQDAVYNASLNNLSNATFMTGMAEDLIPKLFNDGTIPDVIFLDPPRKGCENTLLDALINFKIKRVIYISCDPATLSRDIERLTNGGYTLKEVALVDMFPMTGKIEASACLCI